MTIPKKFTDEVEEWAKANPQTRLTGRDRERFINLYYQCDPSSIKTKKEVSKTVSYQVGRFRQVFMKTHKRSRPIGSDGGHSKEETKKRNAINNPIYSPIYSKKRNLIYNPIYNPINSKKRKQKRKAENKKLLEENDLSSLKLEEQEVKAAVTTILNDVVIDGKYTLQEAIDSKKFAIYFGTTKNALKYEALKFLTTRGRSTRGDPTRNTPILQIVNDEGNNRSITEQTARDKLGAKSVEVYVGRLRSNACAVEDELQKRNKHLHYPYRLYREIAKGIKNDKEAVEDSNFICRTFVTYFKIDENSLVYGKGKIPEKNSAESFTINGHKVTIHP